MEGSETGSNGFAEFENLWLQKLEEKNALESLTDGEIQERIERIKKNCFTLELQNEVIENYLRTHDPSAIRDLNAYLLKKSHDDSSKPNWRNILLQKNKISPSIDSKDSEPVTTDENVEKAVVGRLIQIVNQEIADLCMNSKIRKKIFDEKILSLTYEIESCKAQTKYLDTVLKSLNDFICKGKLSCKRGAARTSELMKFMEEMVRKVTIDVRKCSLEVYNLKKERALVLKKMAEDDSPVLPADLKLLEIEIGKLNTEIAEERKALLSVSYTLGIHRSKLDIEKTSTKKMLLEIEQLNATNKKLDHTLVSTKRYHDMLKRELRDLEKSVFKFKQLACDGEKVTSLKEYIHQKSSHFDLMKKIRSMKRKVQYIPFGTEFQSFLRINTDVDP